MELRDIEYFAVVAEHGHLGRAADALDLSQPALSKSLRRLEQALEVKLVKRTPKGVELTAEGSVLLVRVRELRLSLQNIGREIADVKQGRVGHLRIGVGFPGPEQLLAGTFSALLKDSPQARVTVTVSDNDVMVPALCNGELDLIVNYLASIHTQEGLVREHLYDDQFVVIASNTHRLVARRQVSLADLVHERWCVSALAQISQHRLHEAFRECGLRPPDIAFECRSPRLRLKTVACSDLLDWTSRRFVEQSDLASTVTILSVKELAWLRPIGLIYRREVYQPPAIRRLIEILKAAVKDMRAWR
jgi:DNA-binding transcriptional LysR family regulator